MGARNCVRQTCFCPPGSRPYSVWNSSIRRVSTPEPCLRTLGRRIRPARHFSSFSRPRHTRSRCRSKPYDRAGGSKKQSAPREPSNRSGVGTAGAKSRPPRACAGTLASTSPPLTGRGPPPAKRRLAVPTGRASLPALCRLPRHGPQPTHRAAGHMLACLAMMTVGWSAAGRSGGVTRCVLTARVWAARRARNRRLRLNSSSATPLADPSTFAPGPRSWEGSGRSRFHRAHSAECGERATAVRPLGLGGAPSRVVPGPVAVAFGFHTVHAVRPALALCLIAEDRGRAWERRGQ
ncbi:hypothetical protein C8Q77DRAFT_110917 [Trametes polyzona]|nr:hypothetical protein C8Q77DRAFT_110917 [Trametes polyzona]